jgi:hypothetical protein
MTGLTFTMEAAGVISGKIVDTDGDSIAAVSVNAMLPGSMPSTGIFGSFGSWRVQNFRLAGGEICRLGSTLSTNSNRTC